MAGLFSRWREKRRARRDAEEAREAERGEHVRPEHADRESVGDPGAVGRESTGDAGAVGGTECEDRPSWETMADVSSQQSSVIEPAQSESTEKAAAERARPVTLDATLAAAVDIARDAILEVAGEGEVGDYIGVIAEGHRLATHSFACTAPGYRGWHWIAVLSRAPRSKKVTVCETALLPGDDALLPPAWLPWDERLQPGDVGPRDVLPKLDDDPNLEPGYEETDDDETDRLALYELGLGRERVLSPVGRRNAAERWNTGEGGPDTQYSKEADGKCGSCGYLIALAGSMRQGFGVCANEWSPRDGNVVSLEFGCGAHSETDTPNEAHTPPVPVIDELTMEPMAFSAR
ncbi:DUF3027 domain-containing protein [Saxibacter everestensis]|uniref:DUF3027 domain-containing protein n=1 Tax=Saxibacter everestensis TaxID=2909229 RepID=A0ABY8QWA9_9MICO|nr:DUF3027 domain-containing protein [Brevibacteriaceae bacterium ZFBP1038]